MSGQLAPGGRFGDYLIDDVLGRGAMGVVYRARHERLGRTVALKVLPTHLADSPDYRARFADEARTLAGIDSPHIIQVIDHGELDGALYIATQLVAGGDLSQRLDRDGPLAIAAAVDLAGQVVEAVADAHRAGVLHRDIKPGNVLLAGSPERPFAYLCDFGIARDEQSTSGHTVTGAVVGTWAYLAPERLDGTTATRASDVYALGCLLWAMLTGAPPYQGTEISVALSHRNDPVRQLSGPEPAIALLNGVLASAMAKDPADRFASADAMAAALRHVRSAPGASSVITLPHTPVPPPVVGPPAWVSTGSTSGGGVSTSGGGASTGSTSGSGGPTGAGRRWLLPAAVVVLLLALAGSAAAVVLAGRDDDPAAAQPGDRSSASARPDLRTTPQATSSRPDDEPTASTEPPAPTLTGSAPSTPAPSPSRSPEPSSPAPSTPSAPSEPESVSTVVAATCPSDASDCYLSVRAGPSPDADELYRLGDGEGLDVVCTVPGDTYTSSTRGSSDQWAVLTYDGGYAAALFLDPVGSGELTPC